MMKNVMIAFTAYMLASSATMRAQRGPETAGAAKKDWMVDSRIAFESKTIKGLPYSAELLSESVQSLADGNRIVQRTTGRVYRDSEGRVRREEDRPSGTPSISVTDPMART